MNLALEVAPLVLLIVVAEISFWAGRRQKGDRAQHRHLAALQGALLGLLGLLLAFITAMSEARFSGRRALILAEANAISTEYSRADLFPTDAETAEVRNLIRRYTDARLAFYVSGDDQTAEHGAIERTEAIQREIWQHVTARARARPDPVAALVVAGTNEMIDLEGARRAALDTHVPASLFVLLTLMAVIAVAAIAFEHGLNRKRSWLVITVLPVLMGAAIGTAIDLDSPRSGFMRAGQTPMERARASMGP